MSFSAHKLFGPKGIGLLYHRPEMALSPLIHGATQEFGLNAGTENVSGIIGFSKAVENAYTYYHKKQEVSVYHKFHLYNIYKKSEGDLYLLLILQL